MAIIVLTCSPPLASLRVKSMGRRGENPARWRGHLENLLPARAKVRRAEHAVLPYVAIGTFMTGLRAQEGVSARTLKFAVLIP
jgi:hypothetical protein